MAQVKKSVYRWCWSMLVANKPPIYYTKCPLWPQNLIFGTNGSLEQFVKNILNYAKHKKETLNAFGSALKVEMRFLIVHFQ